MKILIVVLIIFFTPRLILAQTVTVTGNVSDANGVPLRYAFVLDKEMKNATYTDSAGTFKLSAGSASQLVINCRGYKKDSLNVDGKSHFDIILKPDPSFNRSS